MWPLSVVFWVQIDCLELSEFDCHRIVLVLSNNGDALTIASLGRRKSMVTGFAWLLSEDWFEWQDISNIGWLYFKPFLASDMQAFAKQVSDYSKSHFNITVRPDSVNLEYSETLYAAIMLYAHAATRVLSEGGDLQDGAAVTAAVRNTTFAEGVGGTVVVLDSKGDRIESYELMNFVLEAGNVPGSVAVGMFNSTLWQYKAYEHAVVWPGNTIEVPADYFSGEHRCMDFHQPLFSAPVFATSAPALTVSAPVFAVAVACFDWIVVCCFASMVCFEVTGQESHAIGQARNLRPRLRLHPRPNPNPKPETRDYARDPRPETRDPRPETQDPRPNPRPEF